MQRIIVFYLTFLILFGCNRNYNHEKEKIKSNKHANGFRIEKFENLTKLSVFNPWEKANNISFDYYLIPENTDIPDSLAGKKIIKTPVKRIICMSTSHLGFIDALGENKSVVGVSGASYISNAEIIQNYKAGHVVDVGYGQNLNYEIIITQRPDLVMLYGVDSDVTAAVTKLEELGIPVVINAEYLETTPLGKAEWIKFVGAIYSKEAEAEKFFSEIEKSYNSLKELVNKNKVKPNNPKVLVGSPYRDSWWIPGGNSYLANLINDACGYYLGKDNLSHESYVISFENALTWGNEADIWINLGLISSKYEILATDQRFVNFGVFKNGRIFNNTNRMSENGGNDFWESGTVFPNLILRDLISIFHEGTIKEEMVYYREVK
ncbi:MAG: ABC transporter substrate-binding protein [Bacteroidales bacterium]|jgi:iron complex transport system substrate-binding protein|nr:ABC transporter substrate-binding protein [Bacteroidales bacterium]